MHLKKKIILFLLIAALCCAITYKKETMSSIAAGLSIVHYPLLMIYGYMIQPLFDSYNHYKNYREYAAIIERNHQERALLLHELIQARAEINRYKDLYALGMPYERYEHTMIQGVCTIIYKQLSEEKSFIIIDKGSRHGIDVDMIAVVNSLLLGKVTAVYPWYSHVMPITDQRCYVPVVCSVSGKQGLFHGNKLDYISHLATLQKGELLLTSGDGLLYPQGLSVGRIKNFSINDLNFLYDVDVEPLLDIENLTYCSIISKNTQHASKEAL